MILCLATRNCEQTEHYKGITAETCADNGHVVSASGKGPHPRVMDSDVLRKSDDKGGKPHKTGYPIAFASPRYAVLL
jgi:hypothetical protein